MKERLSHKLPEDFRHLIDRSHDAREKRKKEKLKEKLEIREKARKRKTDLAILKLTINPKSLKNPAKQKLTELAHSITPPYPPLKSDSNDNLQERRARSPKKDPK